jgi:hypothetical protein
MVAGPVTARKMVSLAGRAVTHRPPPRRARGAALRGAAAFGLWSALGPLDQLSATAPDLVTFCLPVRSAGRRHPESSLAFLMWSGARWRGWAENGL